MQASSTRVTATSMSNPTRYLLIGLSGLTTERSYRIIFHSSPSGRASKMLLVTFGSARKRSFQNFHDSLPFSCDVAFSLRRASVGSRTSPCSTRRLAKGLSRKSFKILGAGTKIYIKRSWWLDFLKPVQTGTIS